jgi:hypothetical protein
MISCIEFCDIRFLENLFGCMMVSHRISTAPACFHCSPSFYIINNNEKFAMLVMQIYNPPPFWIIDAAKLQWNPLPSPSKKPR